MLPRYDIGRLPAIAWEKHTLAKLEAEGWVGYVKQLRALAYLGEEYRQRNENECSHSWAGNSHGYREGTKRLGKHIVQYADKAGLNIYLQSDCRGAAVYVRAKPHTIDDNAYSSQGHCIFFPMEDES